MRIYVGNVSYGMTESELQDLFSAFGEVQDATIITDRFSGNSKGFGFVEMADNAAATKAIQELNFSPLAGSLLIVKQAREQGFVETVFGRRLYLPDINARNAQRRQYAERTAINAPMQGTAADIIKRAMLAVDAWIGESEIDVALIMQVHDELVLEVDRDRVDEVSGQIVQLMMDAADLKVPLTVDVGVGENWDEAH